MKPKLQELQQEIWRIWEILTVAKDCFQYSLYLHKPDTNEEAEYLKNQRDFKFIRHILWRMSIIELYKIFAKRERFSIQKFIDKLKKDGYFGDVGVGSVILEQWEDVLTNNQKYINDILILRDKIYAHSDFNKGQYSVDMNLTFEEVEILIKLVEDIIKQIYLVVFDGQVDMSTPYFDRSDFNVIKILAQERRNRMEGLFGSDFKNF